MSRHGALITDRRCPVAKDAGLAARLRRTVEALCAAGPRSTAHPQSTQEALCVIAQDLTANGYVIMEHRFGEAPGEVNLLCEAPGLVRSDVVLEVAAHYDTVPESPGADDNASGVAAVLEIAARLAINPAEVTVRFCLFGREESGMHGSKAHVAGLAQRGQSHRGALIFESIGYRDPKEDSQRSPLRVPWLLWLPRTGDFIAAVANLPSRRLCNTFAAAAATAAPWLPVHRMAWQGSLLRHAARSDNYSYWKQGYRALMITDTANFRNPNYHRSSDLPDTIDYEFMAEVVQAAHRAVQVLASATLAMAPPSAGGRSEPTESIPAD
ncbi:M20/M25/M40 family metallo-hydrolase [Sinorhizobium meliloti]|uniref:M20/M25/M40 family metallo-hydrolase n=1 Tax=Rhizobium meliloti TaxID=382 RepID=UPI000FD986F0|nr:M20/M25/M40 family metallo-hydrolase [Sinorhizobium meliloti]RVQ56038.1 M20/M25/M40 family metallo-hydrolase [Sinorhizobium meliloti]